MKRQIFSILDNSIRDGEYSRLFLATIQDIKCSDTAFDYMTLGIKKLFELNRPQ